MKIFLFLCWVVVSYTQCPAGKYNNGTSCVSCSKGTFNYFTGSTFCISCPYGTTISTDTAYASITSTCGSSRNLPCTTWMSSQYTWYSSTYAIDNIFTTFFHTLNNANEFWGINLGSRRFIESIALWDRPDCCYSRINGFQVYISDTYYTLNLVQNPSELCYTDTMTGNTKRAPVIATCGMSGQYVYLVNTRTDYFHFAEVAIFSQTCTYCFQGAYYILNSYTSCIACPAGQFSNTYHYRAASLANQCGTNKNLLCTTWASTYSASYGNTSSVIDGNIDNVFMTGYTASYQYNYWAVDLGTTYTNLQITFFNYAPYTLTQQRFYVFFGSILTTSSGYDAWSNTNCYTDPLANNNLRPITFNCLATGRYLYLLGRFTNTDFKISELHILQLNNVCTACPMGTFNDNIGFSTCTTCKPGFYNIMVGQTSCLQCAMGSISNALGTACTPCPIGSYSVTASSACMACDDGYSTTMLGSTSCTWCADGQYANRQTPACTDCPLGTYAIGSVSACLACTAGTFSYKTASIQCTNCPTGQYSTIIGRFTSNAVANKCANAAIAPCILDSSPSVDLSDQYDVINGDFFDNFKTVTGVDQYWGVDFKTTRTLTYLILYDSTNLLDKFEIWAFSTKPSPLTFTIGSGTKVYTDISLANQKFPLVVVLNSVSARYLYLVSKNPLGLSLAEVEIIQTDTMCTSCPTTTFGFNTGSSTCSQCPPGTMGNTVALSAQIISRDCFENANVERSTLSRQVCRDLNSIPQPSWVGYDLLYSQMINFVILSHSTDCKQNNPRIFIGDFLEKASTYSYNPINQECIISSVYSSVPCPLTVTCKLSGKYVYLVKSTTSSFKINDHLVVASTTCTACGLGTYNDVVGQSVCKTCKTCPANTYYSKICGLGEVSDTSICSPFSTSCPNGYYYSTTPIIGSKTVVGLDTCQKCVQQPGFYITDGCYNNLAAVYKACTVCDVYMYPCSMWDDAVCILDATCGKPLNLQVPTWLQANPTIRCRKGMHITNMTGITPTCTQCPEYLVGLNGVWCEACVGYRKPYWDQSICVCLFPTELLGTGECSCSLGYNLTKDGCQVCPENTYSNSALTLLDNWWTQSKLCLPCATNYYSTIGASVCTECPAYTYRLPAMTACTSCANGFYAVDTTCVACATSCNKGFSSIACPTDSSKFICSSCPLLPLSAFWLEMLPYATEYKCIWQCNPNYYRADSTCILCSGDTDCEPGKLVSPCTEIQDTSCDWDCVNETKPAFNSIWTQGCEWGCDAGFTLKSMDYGMWVQYECVQEGSLPFWEW